MHQDSKEPPFPKRPFFSSYIWKVFSTQIGNREGINLSPNPVSSPRNEYLGINNVF